MLVAYISWLLFLVKLLSVSYLFPSAIAQAIDQDSIDYTIIPGWKDLSRCVSQDCFGDGSCTAAGCYGPNNHVRCNTNKCMCRPSLLYKALQYVVDCARKSCQNLDDVKFANDSMKAYCRIKGYTSILPPILLQTTATAIDGLDITGGYYTHTVSATTTVYTSHATRRVEAGFSALSGVSTKKPGIDYVPWAAPVAVMLLISALYLFSASLGLRA